MLYRATILLWLSAAGFLGPAAAFADVTLPHVLGEHMVLQQKRPIPVWGRAAPGEAIRVRLAADEVETRADASGRWQVRLPALDAGGPYTLEVRGRNTIVLPDILVGEVWLCSGQSNMEMGLGVVRDGAKEAAAADYPQMRLLELPRNPAGEPRRDIDASWRVCEPETVAAGSWGGFTAVGYFFGRMLHQELGVPVGLIDSSWGGTRIEPWTPAAGFAAFEATDDFAAEIERKDREYRSSLPPRLREIEGWVAATRAALEKGNPLPIAPAWPRHPLADPGQPSGLFNGMINPLVPFGIRGAIWYQGESNVYTDDGMAYCDKMKALIRGWRDAWGQGGFPFYYVQIAPFMYHLHNASITAEQMPRIWEAQAAALSIPNTGMVVTTDIANLRDIHPANKQEVGRRLALWALAKTYGRDDLVCSGPLYRAQVIEDGRIRILFDQVGAGLVSRDGKPLDWFRIAAADRVFVDARAAIEGDTVVVWSEAVKQPIAVRFGWHQEAQPNLMNKDGLPASPFRTDSW